MTFTRQFLLGPVFLISDLPAELWWLSPGEGKMPLHDAVGISCKKGATTENQAADVKYMG